MNVDALDRLFTLELEGAGSLAVSTFRGREALSEPYRFDVEVVAPSKVDPANPRSRRRPLHVAER